MEPSSLTYSRMTALLQCLIGCSNMISIQEMASSLINVKHITRAGYINMCINYADYYFIAQSTQFSLVLFWESICHFMFTFTW